MNRQMAGQDENARGGPASPAPLTAMIRAVMGITALYMKMMKETGMRKTVHADLYGSVANHPLIPERCPALPEVSDSA